MKRILLATAGVAVVAVFAATIGLAQPTATTGSVAAEAAAPLPKLPANIKSRQRFIVGVKCDAPPFGYINVQGKNAGFDVEIAKWFARYAFGRESRVSYVCAPTPAREPLLTTGRVDLVISTFTYTTDRDTRIDFSRAYYKATGRLLVKNDVAGAVASRTSLEPEGGDDERFDLRPLDEALLHEHRGDRHGQLHERPARVQPGPRRRADVGRHRPRRRRRRGPRRRS